MQTKSNVHLKEVLLSCFQDSKGVLYHALFPQGHSVTAVVFAQLQKLAEVVREMRPRRSLVHFPHDNGRPHVAKAIHQKVEGLGWETVSHPSYSSDIAPKDYHLFRSLV